MIKHVHTKIVISDNNKNNDNNDNDRWIIIITFCFAKIHVTMIQ